MSAPASRLQQLLYAVYERALARENATRKADGLEPREASSPSDVMRFCTLVYDSHASAEFDNGPFYDECFASRRRGHPELMRALEWYHDEWRAYAAMAALVVMMTGRSMGAWKDEELAIAPLDLPVDLVQWLNECTRNVYTDASFEHRTERDSGGYVTSRVAVSYHGQRLEFGKVTILRHANGKVELGTFASQFRANRVGQRFAREILRGVDVRGVMTDVLAEVLRAMELADDTLVFLHAEDLTRRNGQAALVRFYESLSFRGSVTSAQLAAERDQARIRDVTLYSTVGAVREAIRARRPAGTRPWQFNDPDSEMLLIKEESEEEEEDDDEVIEPPAKKVRMRARFTLHD
ncbi:MAG: hypothetical protein Q7V62_01850 [Actinomycetota bacterium]|nr:hypothetical protein [Actinomycetota bacterium]